MWSGINKRRFPRANYKCNIILKKKGSTKTLATHTENIGGGGICVIVEEDLGLFHGVDVELNLDDGGEVIKCAGTVVWVVKKRIGTKAENIFYDTGVEFVNIDEPNAERILKVVDEILKKEAGLA